ncbi:MAG: peroxiredoxin family protein [Candidatus Eisenbacteria bacterium]|nr:redoxin domain-containing protein [Candidatus Eisenbacteria bacterium]
MTILRSGLFLAAFGSFCLGGGLALAPPAIAVSVGEPVPAFALSPLGGDREAAVSSPAFFAESPATVLVVWDRGCPHCLEVALGVEALADSLHPLGAGVTGIVLGPDDPEAIRDLLWERGIAVTHLWDPERTLARRLALGSRHLGVFVIDQCAVVRAVFDDRIPDLVSPVVPAVRRVLAEGDCENGAPGVALRAASGAASGDDGEAFSSWLSSWLTDLAGGGLSDLAIDGRVRLQATEGAEEGDAGFYQERLENGTWFLHRWDLRLPLHLADGIVFEPWLRVSNEDDEVLTQQEDQVSSRHGSASLRLDRGRVSAVLGAYPLRVSPLLLQRWDEQDAPPIGGGGGVGCACGAGAAGLRQRSLEVLRPAYLFEGLSLGGGTRWTRAGFSIAVPRSGRIVRTDAPLDEHEKAAYRRTLVAGQLEIGEPGPGDAHLGLPAPWGIRLAALRVDDDRRTIPEGSGYVRPPEQDQTGWTVLGRVALARLALELEYASLETWSFGEDDRGEGKRAQLEGDLPIAGEAATVWARAALFRLDRSFDPSYAALTYGPNEEGYRLSGGVRLHSPELGPRDWLAVSGFYRRTNSTSGTHPERKHVASLSLLGRLIDPRLRAEAHLLDLHSSREGVVGTDETVRGGSATLAWEAIDSLEPSLRVDVLKNEHPGGNSSTSVSVWLSASVAR